ncbi:MAG: hypothetical protein D4R67_01935, partial [Bacteroidetes bacterium]
MITKITKIIFIALLGCFYVAGFGQDNQKRLTLEDVIKNRTFSSKRSTGIRPMKEGRYFSQVRKDSLNVYDFLTGDYVRTIVTAADLIPSGDTVPIPISSYELSEDETRILFAKDEESIYRYSSSAYYYIYDIGTKILAPLASGEKQRLATFSPDGNKVAFVRNNNLFIIDVASTLQNPGSSIQNPGSSNRDPVFTEAMQITFDGRINEIINGATDW